MADQLTLVEIKLDELFIERTALIANANVVRTWDDYNFRAGYLQAIREIGQLVKNVRNPVAEETGEIPSILEEAHG